MSRHLFYLEYPAKDWEHGLPVGNGRLGAMVSGGVEEETIILNEESVWYGKEGNRKNNDSVKYINQIRELLLQGEVEEAEFLAKMAMTSMPKYLHPYQPAGDIKIRFRGHKKEVYRYKRLLDMDKAAAKVSYKINKTEYKREIFADSRYQVVVLRFCADGPDRMTFQMNLNRRPFECEIKAAAGNMIIMQGQCGDGIRYCTGLKLGETDGVCEQIGDYISIREASLAVFYAAVHTDYVMEKPEAACISALEKAAEAGWEEIKRAHEKDYGRLFKRTSFQISRIDPMAYPADWLLANTDNTEIKNYLIQLLFAYGRYLLISSSYRCHLPANLQGIWNGSFTPPWESKYTININLQMNYWMADSCGLSECFEPFVGLLFNMLERGKKTARDIYGCRGFVAHHNTDLWGNTDTEGLPESAFMWPMGGAWMSLQLYEHYLYTEDKGYLKEFVLPVIKESVLFFYDYLYRGEDGLWLTGPTISPENTYRLPDGQEASMTMGAAMDNQILRQLMKYYVEGMEKAGIEDKTVSMAEEILSHLPETALTSDGRIMEWRSEYEETEPGHRHISQLFGLYPGNEIKENNKALWEAAKKTLSYRLENGGGHTGWSRAWIICFYARLMDKKAAYIHLGELLKHSIADNLLDSHPPFQIDGNFGLCAGIVEMLVQKQGKRIKILPALPEEWQSGEVGNIRLQNGLSIAIRWNMPSEAAVSLYSETDQSVIMCIGRNERKVLLQAGRWSEFTFGCDVKIKRGGDTV